MAEPRPKTATSSGLTHGRGPFGGRRRQLIVDSRYQLRSGILVGTVAVLLLVVLNASLIFQHRTNGIAAVADVRPFVGGQDRISWALLMLGSAVFLGGVLVVGVLESHRTAGAAYAIRGAVDAIRDGKPQIRVRLRRGDHLQELAKSINLLAETIDAERVQRS